MIHEEEIESESIQDKKTPRIWDNSHIIKNPFILWPSNGLGKGNENLLIQDKFVNENLITSDTPLKYNKDEIKRTNDYDISFELNFSIKMMLELEPKVELTIKVTLPPLPSKKKTLILDLDDTIIHSVKNEDITNLSCENICSVNHINIGEYTVILFLVRPHLNEFLKTLSQLYEIIIFSAGLEEYVTKMIEKLDPNKRYISKILSRESCIIAKNGYYIKDLTVFSNRRLENLVIVDNMAFCFSKQIHNGIYIPSYNGDENDNELLKIMDFLVSVHNVDDIRIKVQEFSKIPMLLEFYREGIK